MKKTYKWIIEIEVDPSWVADGFDMTDERAHEMLQKELPYSHSWETSAKVLTAPNKSDIMDEQGYSKPEVILQRSKEREER